MIDPNNLVFACSISQNEMLYMWEYCDWGTHDWLSLERRLRMLGIHDWKKN